MIYGPDRQLKQGFAKKRSEAELGNERSGFAGGPDSTLPATLSGVTNSSGVFTGRWLTELPDGTDTARNRAHILAQLSAATKGIEDWRSLKG